MSFCRYKSFYETVVRADLLSKMQYKNVHMIPKVTQVSVSGATHAALGKGLDHPVASAQEDPGPERAEWAAAKRALPQTMPGGARAAQQALGEAVMAEEEITIRISLGAGSATETVWTSDLSHEYVTINAEYRT